MKWLNGRFFVRYKGRWINVSLEAQSHGDGFKGYRRLFYHWFRCMIGIHRSGHFAGFVKDEDGKILGFETYTACMYCHGNKKVTRGTDYKLQG